MYNYRNIEFVEGYLGSVLKSIDDRLKNVIDEGDYKHGFEDGIAYCKDHIENLLKLIEEAENANV